MTGAVLREEKKACPYCGTSLKRIHVDPSGAYAVRVWCGACGKYDTIEELGRQKNSRAQMMSDC